MSIDFRPGMVLRYPYLWHWQDARGESEGRKDRPTTVAAAFVARDNQNYLLLLPVTTRLPAPNRDHDTKVYFTYAWSEHL
ncbi:MAG: hypothetical protein ABF979_15850 [Gluconobacter sp.]|uniref:hypothetical protein n=1 Tax=Gluconobacter sp. TaxID=1876758 RepID=UPI0039EB05F8